MSSAARIRDDLKFSLVRPTVTKVYRYMSVLLSGAGVWTRVMGRRVDLYQYKGE